MRSPSQSSPPFQGSQRTLNEAAVWREIARRGATLMYAALDDVCVGEVNRAAIRRLRSYDNPSWGYGPDDHFANLTPDDAVIAAEWLALDAEAEAADEVGLSVREQSKKTRGAE